ALDSRTSLGVSGMSLAAAPRKTPNNLPSPLTSFVGRDHDVERVVSAIAGQRLLTLTGPPGCGKSRLGVEASRSLLDVFPGGVSYVGLGALGDPTLVPAELAEVLGTKQAGDVSLAAALCEDLRDRVTLVIFDGCEHLLDAVASLVEKLLRDCPGVKVMATSRAPLGIPGECALPVGPLALPDGDTSDADELAEVGSVALFVQRARAVAPTFQLTESNAADVAAVCRELDGVPLAIELAAARAKLLQPDQIAARLSDRFRLLTGGARTGLRRQQTLRAAIDWSFDQLDERERAVFRRLAVFRGGWTLAAAEDLCAQPGDVEDWEVLDILGSLVDRSMVVVEEADGGEARYRLLESLRGYGLEKLEQANELGAMRDAHLRLFAKMGRQAEAQLQAKQQVVWYERLDAEQGNLRAALEHALSDAESLTRGIELAAALWRWWLFGGHTADARRFMRAFSEAADARGGEPTVALAKLRSGLGWIETTALNESAARDLCERGLEDARTVGDKATLADALNSMGHMLKELGIDSAGALDAYNESLALRRELGDQIRVAGSLNNIAEVHRALGNFDAAKPMYDEALTINRALGNKSWELINLENYAWLLIAQGQHIEAMPLVRQGMMTCRELKAPGRLVNLMEALACVLVGRGRDELAASIFAAVEAEREARGTPASPSEASEYQPSLDKLRSRLSGPAMEIALAEGRRMRFAKIVEYALDKTSV
ncbi:MAG: tetratricopeptide repeat protein, partial [Planctomycetota bacterium]